MTTPAITVDHIWKKFHRGELHDSLRDFLPAAARRLVGRGPKRSELGGGDFWALEDISFELRRGEALGVIGPNGAGKSTLLKVLSRILRPNRGQYQIHGRLRALLEVGAGFHQDLTGRENIYLNGAILGMKKREIDRKLDAMIDFSGIEPFLDTPVKRYSSGMRARLGFSVMAHLDPEILLVDEVLAVGDAGFRAKCVRHMQDLIRSDSSVIFVSHHLEQVRQLCDRCVVLDQGKVRFVGDVEGACEEYMQTFHAAAAESSEHNGELAPGGKLTGLSVFDENGERTHTVAPHRPLTLEVAYELTREIPELGLTVSFARSDGKRMATCNSLADAHALACRPGCHCVRLNLDGLPFYGDQYFVGLRLFDALQTKFLDLLDGQYPLNVLGPVRRGQLVNLTHTWSTASGDP